MGNIGETSVSEVAGRRRVILFGGIFDGVVDAFEGDGFDVVRVGDGNYGDAIFEDADLAAFLVDLAARGSEDFLEKAISLRREVPRIVVAREGEDAVDGADFEAFALIHRPFTAIEVVDIVRQACNISFDKSARELLLGSQWVTALFENLPLGLLLVSPEGRIVRANDSFVRILGIENLERAERCSDIESLSCLRGFCRRLDECLRRREVLREIFEFRGDRYFEVIYVPVETDHRLVGALMFFKDVTAEEKAVQTLSAIVGILDEGIIIVDRDYKLVWANDVMRKWFDVSKENIGLPCRSIFDGNEEMCKSCMVSKSFEDGRAHRSFEVAVSKDGKRRTFQIFTGPIRNSGGDVVQVVKIIRDVTDREKVVTDLAETKERLEDSNIELSKRVEELAMVMQLSDALQAVDSLEENLHIFLTAVTVSEGCGFNRAFLFLVNRKEKLIEGRYAVGPSSPEEAGRIWSELAKKPVHSFSEALASYRQAMAKGDIEVSTIIDDLRFDLDDDSSLLVRVLKGHEPKIFKNAFSDPASAEMAKALRSDSFAAIPLYAMGKPVGVLIVDNIITHSEITEESLLSVRMLAGHASLAIERSLLTSKIADQYEKLQSVHKKLRENQELLLRAERLTAIGKLAAQMAHEIRNPLVSIGGFARNIAKKSEPGSKVWRGAKIIIEEANRLDEIVEDVLSYSRTAKPHLKETNVNGLISRTLEMVEDQLAAANIETKLDFDADLGEVRIDPDQMTQVFLNLFRNAASAMVDGGVLKVSTKLAGGFVWIDVADSGPGIPSELRKKIFEPFFTTKSSGTGLGLSISYQILEAHNGMIWFTSPSTGGTVFHLKFPVKTNR